MSSKKIVSPTACKTMEQVRAGVDATDQQLIALFVQRFAYMDAAARIKDDRNTVRDEVRKAEVIANARKAALDQRLPQDLIAGIWDTLVEGSIAYETERWDAIRS
jgi:isochorismate pyruvate lyase